MCTDRAAYRQAMHGLRLKCKDYLHYPAKVVQRQTFLDTSAPSIVTMVSQTAAVSMQHIMMYVRCSSPSACKMSVVNQKLVWNA
jgi:hypothetical protein